MFTQLGWVMKIQDSNPPKRPGPITCTVFTQSLNPHNFEKYIANIAQKVVDRSRTSDSNRSYLTSGVGPTANPAVLGTGAAIGLGAAAAAPAAPAAPFGFFGSMPAAAAPAMNTSAPAMNFGAPAMNAPAPAMNYAPPPAQQNEATYGGRRTTRRRRRYN